MSTETATDLYLQAQKADIQRATWERRATQYAQRGKLDMVAEAKRAARAADAHAAELRDRAQKLDTAG